MSKRTCSVGGCGDKHSARGYCAVHYQHWYRYGDPLHYAPPGKKDCSFPGCPGVHDSHGYCSAHAKQLSEGVELHPLRLFWHGAACTIADCDEPIIAQGFCHKHWRAWNKYGDPLHRQSPSRYGPRRYTLDEAYFDDITTEGQAYWLGFITADGCLIRSGGTHSLRVELGVRDKDHVRRLADALGSDRPVTRYRPRFVGAAFDSWRLLDSLERLGMTPRKSLTAVPWAGPADLMPHYWRGLFDGDGSISKVRTQREAWTLSLIGSHACVDEFAHWAREVTGSKAQVRPGKGGTWIWAVQGGPKPQRLAEALYGGATVVLPRKHARAMELAAFNYVANRLILNARRSVAMRQAWADGRFAHRGQLVK